MAPTADVGLVLALLDAVAAAVVVVLAGVAVGTTLESCTTNMLRI